MNNKTRKLEAEPVEVAIGRLRERIQTRGDLPHVTVNRQLELVEQLSEFEFGRYLIQHQGAVDGYWTDYAIRHNVTPFPNLKPLERFMFEKTPYAKALVQTFRSCQKILQANLREGIFFASIPSGVMSDLLMLDYRGIKNFELMGVDIDLKTIRYAQDLAYERGLTHHVHFYERDAWRLGLTETCHAIVSNGLHFYEPDVVKQQGLYRQFYDALKPNGFLLISYLTPPPGINHRCEWVLDKISLEDALLQRILYFDVLDSCWQTFHTTEQMKVSLEASGFENIQILSDEARLFPLAIAQKL